MAEQQLLLFPLGLVVPSQDLVGREPAVTDMMDRLRSGQNLLVAGPRRIGKTSVAAEALRRLRADGAYTARIDLQAVTSEAEFAEAIADACLENLTKTARAFRILRNWARGRVPEVQIRTALGQHAEFALSFTLRAESEGKPQLDEVLSLPQEMAVRASTRFFVAYDEFQAAAKFGARTLARIRAAMMLQDRVHAAFLGSQATLLTKLFTRQKEPFYRFAFPWALPPVPAEEWKRYLLAKYSGMGISATVPAVDHILQATGTHPMDTMLLANETLRVARELNKAAITAEEVHLAFERVIQSLARPFEETWNGLAVEEQHVLRRLATGDGGPYAAPAPNHAQVKRAVDRLLDIGVLLRHRAGVYSFIEPLLAEHIRRLVGVDDVR